MAAEAEIVAEYAELGNGPSASLGQPVVTSAATHAAIAVGLRRFGRGRTAMNDRKMANLVEIGTKAPASPAKGNGVDPSNDPPRPLIICPTAFKGLNPPARRWIVRDWIPYEVVTGLYGDGGVGKSLLSQQLQTGTALGSSWIGLPVDQVASLGVYCEDGRDELWRRQEDINVAYATSDDALELAHWMPRLGEDNILMTFTHRGAGELTVFHRHVLEAALDLNARLVIIDTAADTFGGSENDRGQVRQFVQRALGGIALKIDGALVCCAHPSRYGITSGEGDSGSTGWSNAFRSRAYLNRPKADDGAEVDSNERLLTRKKANFASVGDVIKLHWQNGVLVPESGSSSYFRPPIEDVFLALLDAVTAEGQRASPNLKAGNYAPALFMRRPQGDRGGYQRGDFERAMQALLKARKIKIEPYGPPSDHTEKLAQIDAAKEP